MAFRVSQPDLGRSPQTGMVREHWKQAARWLLEGVLQHVEPPDQPLLMPGDRKAGTFADGRINLEALARTFMLAAPLIAEDPGQTVAGLNLTDYYAAQIAAALDEQSPQFLGHFDQETARRNRPVCGHTVEGAALCLGLLMAGPALWDSYPADRRDRMARWISGVAHGRTNGHNWRWFNVLMLTFLQLKGYEASRAVMRDHLQHLLAWYAGDGWYRDGGQFDFYSSWAFQFYAPVWCRAFGYRHEPQFAAQLERRHADLMETLPLLFSRAGHGPMWGRSTLYRCAASSPLAAAFLLKTTPADPGVARRICSGNLLQFAARDDVFDEGVATTGFYRHFPPVVQSYSHPASPYWLSKLFVALHLPPDSPFWTAVESEGHWTGLGAAADSVSLTGPGLTLTAHGPTGQAELRGGKAASSKSNLLYTRLVYNTAFCAEADNPDGATADCYSVRELDRDLPFAPMADLRFAGVRDNVLYRQAHLPGWMGRVDLAEIIIPGGVIRVDRIRLGCPNDLLLGHFGLPHLSGAAVVERHERAGRAVIAAQVPDGRAVALVALHGWDEVGVETHAGLSAEADESTVLYARRTRREAYAGMGLVITLLLHRTDGQAFGAEVDAVASVTVADWAPSGSPLGATIYLAGGAVRTVDFGFIEGNLSQ